MFQFQEVYELYGNHLEADTSVMFHVNHADKNGNGSIIVRGNDTDIIYIAIILTCNANFLTNNLYGITLVLVIITIVNI